MSKKNVSGFVNTLGALLDFVIRLMAAFTKLGGTDEQFHELITGKKSEEFINQVVNLAMKTGGTVRDSLRIVVDYSKSLAEMVKAGKYNWVNIDITADHFPVKGSGKTDLIAEILGYGDYVSSEEIIKDMDRRGFRPATIAELLAFDEAYPDKQREFPIVALGSVWQNPNDLVFVVYLLEQNSRRSLALWCGLWYDYHRFLAFRK
jgi:hypothetical protein